MSTIVSKGPMRSLTRWLDDNHVDHEVHEHERSLTALATARAEGVDPRSFAKVVWVRTVEGGDALIVVDAEDHLDLRKARAVLHSKKVTLKDEDEIAALTPDCDPGAMPAVGALFGLPTYADEAIATASEISFNAGSHACAVRVDRAAWEHTLGVVYGDLASDTWRDSPRYRP
jgi:Ala-tRNA(Pro) deacylase